MFHEIRIVVESDVDPRKWDWSEMLDGCPTQFVEARPMSEAEVAEWKALDA